MEDLQYTAHPIPSHPIRPANLSDHLNSHRPAGCTSKQKSKNILDSVVVDPGYTSEMVSKDHLQNAAVRAPQSYSSTPCVVSFDDAPRVCDS
ncbi:uncharacterized protein BDV17DRAFT_272826 [Aspergillus undulatus]|uniref:uncharacterized protein n=1 Tax=Aspergillus undulatus TaxID=1810928 RepID=UPI003CCD22A3